MEIPFQIGCQLGESGLLSAAGRALGLVCRDALYYDGSYDAFLLSENLTTENVAFGAGGAGKELPGNGLGVEVDRDRLLNMSRSKKLIIKRP
jgi:muconate cycloisomerase